MNGAYFIDHSSLAGFPCELEEGEWTTISTKVGEDTDGRTTIYNVELRPGHDITVDLKYDGPITCLDDTTFSLEDVVSFPIQNALMHSAIMKETEEGYQFTKQYGSIEEQNPTLAQLRKKAGTTLDRVTLSAVGLKPQKHLLGALEEIHHLLAEAHMPSHDGKKFYNFPALFEQLKEGSYAGDCKATATVAAGLLHAYGIPQQIVDGDYSVAGTSGEQHVWNELILPTKKGNIHLPFDVHFEVLGETDTLHSFMRQYVPDFNGEGKASLRLSYNQSI